MKKRVLIPIIIVATATICYTCLLTEARSLGVTGKRPFPKELSSKLPYDVDESLVRGLVKRNNILAAHREFGILAWQTFIALNWPAKNDGEPDPTTNIVDTAAPRVWEFWKTPENVFLPDGMKPRGWSSSRETSNKYMWKSAWRQHTTAPSNLQAFSGPLVDQNGNWVRYQTRINKEEFDYIVSNELYSLDGQVRFSQRETNNRVEFPLNLGKRKHGAIELKLAWKELGANDDPSRFLVREIEAELSEPPVRGGGRLPPRRFKAGLVGMHIAMRTESSPEWIWSTFEHIDNTRTNNYPDGTATHPLFFSLSSASPPNLIPEANATQDKETGELKLESDKSKANLWAESLTKTPVQVRRIEIPTQPGLNPLDGKLGAITRELNLEVQKLLASKTSVFQYYELIDTQWPVHPNKPAFSGGAGSAPESVTYKSPGDMVPVFLVNSIMETYFQKGDQPAGPLEQDDRLAADSPPIDATRISGSESCVGCHYSAGIALSFKRDLLTGREIIDKKGRPTPVFGQNANFGNTGAANYSWLLQIEPQARKRKLDDPRVIIK